MSQYAFHIKYISDCISGCEEGKFGTNCENKCNCENGATCDSRTGTCLCPLGYIGPTCTQPCPRGYTGQNCEHVCKCRNEATCDPKNGKCICPPGYHGDRCQFSKSWIVLFWERSKWYFQRVSDFTMFSFTFSFNRYRILLC